MRSSATRRMANWVAGCALRLLPASRLAWALAMRSEMAYLSDPAALRWASGLLFRSAYTEG